MMTKDLLPPPKKPDHEKNPHAQAMGRLSAAAKRQQPTPSTPRVVAKEGPRAPGGRPGRYCDACGLPVKGWHKDTSLDATCPGRDWHWHSTYYEVNGSPRGSRAGRRCNACKAPVVGWHKDTKKDVVCKGRSWHWESPKAHWERVQASRPKPAPPPPPPPRPRPASASPPTLPPRPAPPKAEFRRIPGVRFGWEQVTTPSKP